jgi:hypothetical protein
VALTIASSLPYHVGTDGRRHYWQVKETPDKRWQPIHGWDGVDGEIVWRDAYKPRLDRDDAIRRARDYALYLAKKS